MHNGEEPSMPDNEHGSVRNTVTKTTKPEVNGVSKEMDGQQHINAQETPQRYEPIISPLESTRSNGQNGAPPKASMSPPRIVTTLPRDTPPVSAHVRALSDGHDPITSGMSEIAGAGRRSVQFTRDTIDNEQGDGNNEALDERGHAQNGSTLYSRIRAFATSPSFIHPRISSGANTGDIRASPRAERNDAYFPMTLEEDGSEADADAEESAAEQEPGRPSARKRRRKNPILHEGGIKTAPATPGTPMRPALLSSHSLASADEQRPAPPLRRATTNDIPENPHAVSEDEGRNRLNASSPSRMRAALRGLSYGQGQRRNNHGTPEAKRPTTMKRLTGLVGHADVADSPSRRHRMKGERGTSLSAQKWRQIKQQLKLLGPKKGKDRTIDHEKSAELLAELIAGSPAALMLASMFQRDEHGSKRVPVLLEQLKVKIVDSEYDGRSKESDAAAQSDRHMVFRIELEYGNGLNRMKWTIRRSLRDFANLHLKYKLHFSTQKYVRLKAPDDKGMPRFPKSAFPYLKQARGLEDEIEDDDDEAGNETEGVIPGTGRPAQKHSRRSSFALTRRRSSVSRAQEENSINGVVGSAGGLASVVGHVTARRETYHERQRKKLEVYIQKMIKFMLFRADSNRLCKFLEVSALGLRLAAEGGYHGKEGFLVIRSGKGLDFRKALTPANFKGRHTPKWFLVRHSYVVCVDSPEEMHIYDVFLFDEDFKVQPPPSLHRDQIQKPKVAPKPKPKQIAQAAKESASLPQHHRLKLYNAERKMKLLARNERQLQQFEDSIRSAVEASPWTKPNRFGSFAPVRPKCFAQWLVDGRDHMWVVSRAIDQAKDVIYIHDWWLSPELYMRRPPAISQKWRLDRLLKRKAEQGVKIFVIVYRNVESAIPIDSQYTKFSLLDLHPNVFVQRSPNQFRQNTFFWAHHEKLCIVDHTLAFVGGIDLCFGRWDTPQHTVVDDKSTGFEASELPKDADHCQLWPGKDYSNPRVQDFFALNKPYEEMYDRSCVPRMPWHDISMQVVGQPARDLTRHFVQRWNYILRQRKPTRPTPFLLPPPDFNPADLEALGLDGTCEVQILRSCGPWSIGTPDKTEHSIMTAYTKMIEESEHFVYIENQFFISSCVTDVTTIKNTIGDALVERVVRAAKNEEAWRAMIVIPLMPGFQNTVDSEGGTSIRLIMQYQFRSICRGESSIFGRLRAQGIEPEDYIQFYGLRAWGKIGPRQRLVTEQLYIHAKCMIVDDRVAIIGSANINERSMLGNRDSECASIVRDTDMFWSKMNGQPYLVGRFPHTLRVRLMREHLGLDVDKIMEDAQLMETELQKSEEDNPLPSTQSNNPDHNLPPSSSSKVPATRSQPEPGHSPTEETLARAEDLSSFNHDIDWEQADNPNLKSNRKLTEDARVTGNPMHRQDVEGKGPDNMKTIEELGYGVGRDTAVIKEYKEVLVSDLDTEGKNSLRTPLKRGEVLRKPSILEEYELGNPSLPPRPENPRSSTAQLGLMMLSQLPPLPDMDDTDIGGPALQQSASRSSRDHRYPLVNELRLPMVDKGCMADPILDAFSLDTWHTIAENNAKIFRSIFRCMPDNEVKGWKEYKEYVAYSERFEEMQGEDASKSSVRSRPYSSHNSGPPGSGVSDRKTFLAPGGRISGEGQKLASGPGEKSNNATKDTNGDTGQGDHDDLRAWAVEANKAQAERQHRDLSKEEASSSQESAPLTIPESHPSSPTLGDDREPLPDLPISPPSNEKPGLQFVGYSEAINMNSQTTTRRRRRATTRSGRREFAATDDIPSKVEAEELLNLVQGHLVVWPYDWYELRIKALYRASYADTLDLGWLMWKKAVTGCILLTRSRRWKYSEYLPLTWC
jgi:phospholipase D1/2